MVERFSPEWIEHLDVAVRDVPGGEPFVIQQVVGEAEWHVRIGADGVRVVPGRADDADVTFTQDRATAEAIASGTLSAGAALTSGDLRVNGATAELITRREVMAAIDEAVAGA